MNVSSRFSSAFSLFELFATLAMALILFYLAAPSFSHLLKRSQLVSITNHIVHAIRYARTAAIQQQSVITFCGSSTDKKCDGRWQAGQIILNNKSGKVLRKFGSIPQRYQLIWRSSFGRNDYLQLTPDGFTNGQQGRFILKNKQDNSVVAQVVVLRSGRVRVVS